MNMRLKNALFGLIGGAAGTFVIDQAIAGLKKLQPGEDKSLEKRLTPEPPTDVLAERIVSEDKKAVMSQTIHWGYGIFWGGVYGMLRKEYPRLATALGLPFASAFTMFGEGLMLPSMGLTAPAYKYPASTLVRDVTAHWAYTATVEGTCRLLETAEQRMSNRQMRTNPELRRAS
jgi:putative membrane protein